MQPTTMLAIAAALAGVAIVLYLLRRHGKGTVDAQMLEALEKAHFNYFVQNQDPVTGLVRDRSTGSAPCSIAAQGFAFTAYAIAAQRRWITRAEAAAYTVKVLRLLAAAPQSPAGSGLSGYCGYFYHMLDPRTGLRATPPTWWNSELSSIDTALLMAGVLFARNYFDGDSVVEREIRELVRTLYERVEWPWMANEKGLINLAWSPENGFTSHFYRGHNEAVLLMILAASSPTHPLKPEAWEEFICHSQPVRHYGELFIETPGGPMFTYQYPQAWIDFRGIRDALNRRVGFDYFENARRATVAHYRYAIDNPHGYRGYGPLCWGLTACDGPGWTDLQIDGRQRSFFGYSERGAPGGHDDGTIAPTAAASSLPFAPELVLPLLREWVASRPEILRSDGFADAFNPTFDASSPSGWISPDTVGIDQGAIVLMVENYRTGLVWKIMRKDADLRRGLRRCGFAGGWLR